MRDNVGGGERLLSERESSLLGLRSEANKLRGVLALIPEDAQQLAFQLNTFAQNCSRLETPTPKTNCIISTACLLLMPHATYFPVLWAG